MSAHRFFLTAEVRQGSGPLRLPMSDADVHHARSVLRLVPGEMVEAAAPGGEVWLFRLTDVSAEGLTGKTIRPLDAAEPPPVVLVQGVAKGEKMDLIVRQAVELGVAEIVPVLTSRSVVRVPADKRASKAERWQRIAKAAAEQSHRPSVPVVHAPIDFAELPRQLRDLPAAFVLWEEAAGPGLSEAVVRAGVDNSARIAIVVGPEGGLAPEEIAALEDSGVMPVTLGSAILRTETAAVVGLALALDVREAMGSAR